MSYLEEKHNKYRLRKLGFRPGHKADAQRPQRGDAHEEVFAQGLAFQKAFGRFLEGVPTYRQVGDKIQQKVLPGGPVGVFFDDDGHHKQRGSHQNLYAAVLPFPVVMVVFMAMVVVFMVVAVVMVFMVMFMMVLMVVAVVMVFMACTFVPVDMFFFHVCKFLLMQR